MKTKDFQKKLVLSKETIANMNIAEMDRMRGGTIPTGLTECRTKCVTGCDLCPTEVYRTCDC